MESLNQPWSSIILLAFVFGLRHGFDPDHLATIDGLTRWHLQRRTKLVNWCGTLFSAGHGMVVIVIAAGVSLLARRWDVPDWLSLTGAGISISFLLLLGVLNLHAALRTRADETVTLQGVKSRWLGGLIRAEHPLLIAGIGMLFAFSFDTVSLAALFALTAERFDGVSDAVLLGSAFTLGMWTADGANGLWIARLLRRADATARSASRILGLAVGALSLLVAAFGLTKMLSPAVDRWSEEQGLTLGLGIVVLPALFLLLALYAARTQSIPSRAAD